MDTKQKSETIISFCTGMRGLERGIERSGSNFRTVCYVEIEAFLIENLVRAMEKGMVDEAPVWSDLKTFPSQYFRGKVHGIVGGYPCQPFSVAGKQKGTEDPRHLWPYIKQHIEAIRPIWCFFENVPGHINIGFREVKSDLEQMGYGVEAGIFSAEEVGAPHQRKRLFILAVLENSNYSGIGSGELGNTSIMSTRADGEGFDCERINSNSERNGAEKGNRVTGSGEKLADTNNERPQGWNSGELQERSSELPIGKSDSQWPSRPNEQQHDWEEPRTTLSGLGVTINGYNFREDLLRMAGNGVVPATAELAWKTLWNKVKTEI